MERKTFEMPVFFPSASRVKIPFVGDDTRHIKPSKSSLGPPGNPLARHQKSMSNILFKQATQDVTFSLDVIKERSLHSLPFHEHNISKVYDCSDIVSSSRLTSAGGRFSTRGYRQKTSDLFKKQVSPRASKMKFKPKSVTERGGDVHPATLRRASEIEEKYLDLPETNSISQLKQSPNKFVHLNGETSDRSATARRKLLRMSKSGFWDEQVIEKLSKDTARWIVSENIESGLQKERLDSLLKRKFGPKFSHTDLIREGDKDDFEEVQEQKLQELKMKLEEEKRAKKLEKRSFIQSDPILSQTFAQYYHLPRHLKQKNRLETKRIDAVNQTAQDIKVKHLEPPPPTKMEDFLNPSAGESVFATDNAFEQQLYTNQAKLVHQRGGDKTRIIMNDLSEYQCNLQPVYPPSYKRWSENDSKDVLPFENKDRVLKGMLRWKKLPHPADFASELGLNLPRSESAKTETIDISKNDNRLENAPMIHIIEEWRSKWKLAGRWQEVTLADVVLDMESLHSHVRLAAVAVCAVAALHKKPVEEITVLAMLPKIDSSLLANKEDVGHLFTGLLEKVRERLHDSHKRVRLAAAMCLYTLSEYTSEVMDIIKHNLEQGIPADRMACAQCLALKGSTDAKVVHLIIQMLLETDEQDQATALLIHLSENTSSRLVHSLLAEQLNSCCWKDKVIACNVLSQLHGSINRDLVHKLSNLMWEDWSSEVRNAAARTLGRTGHGRDIHFDLREKLVRGNERVCADVLRKIGHLGIMTATLLPEFLKCFSAEYVSVRLEAVRAAATLRIKEVRIVNELLRLTEYDSAWKIKAHAIKAIGEIGILTEKIEKALVWAVRFENEAGIRMEACVAIRNLEICNDEVLLILQDRVLVEPDPIVKQEIKRTLRAFGITETEDNMEMVRQIKQAVKRLCKKSVVAAKVIIYEQELDKFERKAQYIGNIGEDTISQADSDVIDLEITQALKRSKSAGQNSTLQTPSEIATPLITFTPGTPVPERQFASDKTKIDSPTYTIEEEDTYLSTSTGQTQQQSLPAD